MKRKIYLAIIILMLGVISCTDLMYLGLNNIDKKLYPIYTEADLLAIDDSPELLSRSYILMNDIDLEDDSVNFQTIGTGDTGTETKVFTGKFYGNGKTISDLRNEYGFFYKISGGLVKDLTISIGTDLTVNVSDRGVLARFAEKSTIKNCSVGGSLISGLSRVGGLVGFLDNSTVENCSSSVNVRGNSTNIGGLVGRAEKSTINNSFATGDVRGYSNVGGLVGFAVGIEDDYCEINYSYHTVGSLILDGSGSSVGGLIGNLNEYSSVRYSFSASVVDTTGGGFIGINMSGLANSDCYWDTTILTPGGGVGDGTGDDTGIEGMSTVFMKDASRYTNWNFSSIWAIDGTTPINSGYPYLRSNPPQ